jgi:3-isopropylmalate/(R)-2-methylmalate dehydratase small subunit
MHIEGRARRFGDDVNTDYIIASTRKRDTLDEQILKAYLFETIDPAFAATVRPDDVIVAGNNFGCGSAMEIAATVILAAGIRAIVARSFSRTFFRNAINNGLLPVEGETATIREGDNLGISYSGDGLRVANLTSGAPVADVSLPPLMKSILDAGGLVPYVRAGGWR